MPDTLKGNADYLLIGSNGLIGRRIGRLLTEKNIPWTGSYNKRQEPGLVRLNILEPSDIEVSFTRFKPRIVINCANLAGGVDFCEADSEAAERFHLKATKDIGMRCKEIAAKMVYISSDYVFDGAKESYSEEDRPNPLNRYGKLKLMSESWIKENLKDHIIIRTTNVYGWDPDTITPNFAMGLYRALKDKKTFNAPSFLWGSPTYAGDLANAILELCSKRAGGIFHIVGDTFTDRFEWAKKCAAVFNLDRSLIRQVREPSPSMVPRPLKARLDTSKFKESYKTALHDLSESLELMRLDMLNQNII